MVPNGPPNEQARSPADVFPIRAIRGSKTNLPRVSLLLADDAEDAIALML